jgi:CRP-like cAMP-binding protein
MGGRVTHSLVDALRRVPSLESLDDRTLLELVGDSANLFWPGGASVFTKGTPGDALYIVLAGAVRVLGDDGGELSVLGPGDFFGELSLLGGSPHQNDVETIEATELMVVPKERFDALLAEYPELGRAIHRRAEERLAANAART